MSGSNVAAQFQPALAMVQVARRLDALRRDLPRDGDIAQSFAQHAAAEMVSATDALKRIAGQLSAMPGLSRSGQVPVPEIIDATIKLSAAAGDLAARPDARALRETLRHGVTQITDIAERLTAEAQNSSASLINAARRRW